MPPRYLRKGPSKLKKCDEFRVDVCDTEKADGCCGVLACNLCLEFEEYGVDPEYGSASFATNSWSGTVAGLTFVAYWERNYTTDECEFVVVFDDEEVYRASCYEGASCRDPGGSVEVSIPYAEGTLTWSVDRKRPLPYVVDPDTGCRTWFCGACECTAECLCVTVTDGYTGEVSTGEICDSSYSDCDAPLWEGTIGDRLISLELSRDSYGECILLVSVDGAEEDPVYITGCTDITATIELYDGTTIEVTGKECVCAPLTVYPCECRRDGDATTVNLVSGGDTCSISTPPTSYVDPTIVPAYKRAWNDGDCVFGFPVTYKITAFPPDCIDPDTSRFIVFVQKYTTIDTPFIDNTLVQQYEWYGVVYDDDDYSIVDISYEYAICCKNDTPTDPATSHLIWIEIENLDFGGPVYTMRMTNLNAVAAYGDC